MAQPAGGASVVADGNYRSTVPRNKLHTPQQRGKTGSSANYGYGRTAAQLAAGKDCFHQRITALRTHRFHDRTDNTPYGINDNADSQYHTGKSNGYRHAVPVFAGRQITEAEQQFFRHSHHLAVKQQCQGKRANDNTHRK